MKHRSFLHVAAALAASAGFLHATETEKPNILILYADDMGYGDLGANNPDSKIPTPHLDRLAAEGMRFTDGHSSSGLCTPSRYSLLTGRHHWRDFHSIANEFDGPVFKPGQLTMQAMLRQQGYATACIGKWHLGMDWDAIRKPGTPRKSIEHTDFDWSKPFPGGPLDHGFEHYYGDNVINFPPYAWIEDDRFVAAPDITFKSTPKKTKESNTIVVFSSDNGPEKYAYARDEKYDHWSAAPFRGLKRDIYEGGHHVPFLIKWPGVTKPGVVTDALISQVDVMATLADVTSFDLPRDAAADSHDFLPWLKGEASTPPRSAMVHNTNAKEYAIRSGDWLLVDAKSGAARQPTPEWVKKHNQPPDDDQPVELYNLKDDIGQRNNLAAKHPEKVSELQALLKKLRDQGHSAPRLN